MGTGRRRVVERGGATEREKVVGACSGVPSHSKLKARYTRIYTDQRASRSPSRKTGKEREREREREGERGNLGAGNGPAIITIATVGPIAPLYASFPAAVASGYNSA